MFERSRRIFFSVGLSFIVLTTIICGLGWYSSYQAGNRQARQDKAETDAAYARTQAEVACAIVSPPDRAACEQHAQAAADHAKQPDPDLKAQQDMAEWAFLAFITAVIGTTITGAGIFYVAGTFRAALAANRGFQESAERQLRAYVSFDGLEITSPLAHRVLIRPNWKNTGQTPTRNMLTNYGYALQKDRLPNAFSYPDESKGGHGRISLGAGEVRNSGGPLIDSAEWEEVETGKSRFFLWAWAEYNDVFEHTPRRRTEVCVQVLFSRTDGTHMTVHSGPHNGADTECLLPLKTTGKT